MRTIRVELLIATLALLASAAASIATIVQTRVVANQLSASVWPYLTVQNSFTPDSFELDVINQGLGPAIVGDVALTVSGERKTSWKAALHAMLATELRAHKAAHISNMDEHDFETGSVVRPGESQQLISIRSPIARDLSRSGVPKAELEVCYCSILEQCWIANEDAREQPRSVPRCSGRTSILTL